MLHNMVMKLLMSRDSLKTRRWIVITVLALALIMPVSPVSAAPSASITITPPLPDPAPVGSEVSFALVITVTDITPGVAGADVYLGYDDTRVVPPTSPNSVVEPFPDFFGPSNITWYEVLPKDKCPGGTNPCIHLVAAGPAQETHSGAAARFHFQVKAAGEACFLVLASKMVDQDGFPVNHTLDPKSTCNSATPTNTPTNTPTDTPTPTPTSTPPPPTVTVKGTVIRQGTSSKPNMSGGTLACSEVKIIPPIVPSVLTVDLGVDNFKFELINPTVGTYKLRAEYPGYLASETLITISAGSPRPLTIDVGTTTLCGGDVNADSVINILDIGRIIGNFGSAGVEVRSDLSVPPVFPADCTDPDEPTDINDDGLVNISDLAIAAGNWGPKNNKGPTLWRTDLCDP